MTLSRPVNIAVVGAGPAGIHTADILKKQSFETRVDLFERLPVPYGLARYGVAPDHPKVTDIVNSLHDVLDRGDVRLVAGIDIGRDVSLDTLREAYDAVVLATGASVDMPLEIPGVELNGSFGAAEFVAWYSAHPDSRQDWTLDSEQVAVIGAGNVALDITRILATDADDLLGTDIPQHVYETLRASRVTDVHVFARRGPAEAAFSPDELRKLDEIKDVDVIVGPKDMVFTRASEYAISRFNQRKVNSETLKEWSERDPSTFTGSRRIHLHFMEAPASIDGNTLVTRLTVERTEHLVNGMVKGIGEFQQYPVGQVYRAVGYTSAPLPGIGYDHAWRRLANTMGRVLDEEGETIPGLYASGWIKRGPVGLIGSTKADSLQTVTQLAQDVEALAGDGSDPLPELLEQADLESVDWEGWLRVDAAEQTHGLPNRPGRVRIFDRDQLLQIARGQDLSKSGT